MGEDRLNSILSGRYTMEADVGILTHQHIKTRKMAVIISLNNEWLISEKFDKKRSKRSGTTGFDIGSITTWKKNVQIKQNES